MSFADVSSSSQRRIASRASKNSDTEGEYGRFTTIATNNISQISSNVGTIRRLCGSLGTPKDTVDLREKIHAIIEETKLLAQDTKGVIGQLGNLDSGYQVSAGVDRKYEQRKLGEDFSKVLKAYTEAIKESARKEREFVAKTRTRQRSNSEEEKLGLLHAEQSHELMHMENEIEFNEAILAERWIGLNGASPDINAHIGIREAGIKEVESTVREVNEIFRDLAVMVNDQGQMIDDIESSVVMAHERTSQATQELKKAAESQRRARRTMCCLVTILVVVLVLILLIITNKI